MNEDDRRYLTAAAGRIEKLLAARGASPLRPVGLTPDLQTFGEHFDRLLDALEALRHFAITLANGDLAQDAPPGVHLLGPLKHLQSSLRHLTWQTQRVAAGDLDQHVDFLGEFSDSFNQMIQALREKRAAEERVRYLSAHDSLTGLYNRAYFNEELDRLRAAAGDYPVGFLIADLDGLKTANDAGGHQVGDLLIKKAAQVLQHGTRAEDVVARIGGDEFAIVLHGADEEQAGIAIAQIRATMDTFYHREVIFPISMSLGAGIATNHCLLEDALRRADEAMYQDKIQRKGYARNAPAGLDQPR